jgi:hypothetical protein
MDKKEINRRKQNRSEARKNLAASRMRYSSWSNFGKQFSEALIHLEMTNATEAQVNATIKVILLRSAKAILPGEKDTDTELQDLSKAHPRLREKW